MFKRHMTRKARLALAGLVVLIGISAMAGTASAGTWGRAVDGYGVGSQTEAKLLVNCDSTPIGNGWKVWTVTANLNIFSAQAGDEIRAYFNFSTQRNYQSPLYTVQPSPIKFYASGNLTNYRVYTWTQTVRSTEPSQWVQFAFRAVGVAAGERVDVTPEGLDDQVILSFDPATGQFKSDAEQPR